MSMYSLFLVKPKITIILKNLFSKNNNNIQIKLIHSLQEVLQEKDGKLYFLKVHAPWNVLLFYAEELNFKAPLEVSF